MEIERVLVERAVVALMGALTPQQHLALRVTTEHRGGCGYQRCAPSCTVHRELIAELWQVLEGGSDATTEAASRGEDGARSASASDSDPATAAGGRARPAGSEEN